MKTSVSDDGRYPPLCARAAEDDEVFAHFKRQKVYQRILEHPYKEMGWIYLAAIVQDHSMLVSFLDRFRENDVLGDPVTFDYGYYGRFSPTTLRYIEVLGQLVDTFDFLTDMDIVEIGAGYGGQAFMIDRYCRFRSYTIIDLAPCLSLARKYLYLHRVPDVRFWTAADIPGWVGFDLVISNFAFSECARSIQEFYLERILKKSSCGYLTCNNVDPSLKTFSQGELLKRLPGARATHERPPVRRGNYIVTWQPIHKA